MLELDTTMQQVVQQLADESGQVHINIDDHIDTEIDINIRDDNFQLFEADNGRLYIKTEEMPQEMFAEVLPTSEGPITEITTQVEVSELELCEPAERAETPNVDATASADVIVD